MRFYLSSLKLWLAGLAIPNDWENHVSLGLQAAAGTLGLLIYVSSAGSLPVLLNCELYLSSLVAPIACPLAKMKERECVWSNVEVFSWSPYIKLWNISSPLILLLLASKKGLEEKNSLKIWHRWQKIRGKKNWPQETVSSNMHANLLIKKASGHLEGLKKKKFGDGSPCCQTFHGIENRASHKIIFLQVSCLGWRMQRQGVFRRDVYVVREGSTGLLLGTSLCSSSLELW